jgi:hypothetical protein
LWVRNWHLYLEVSHEHSSRGIFIGVNHYKAMTSENITNCEHLVCAVVNCWACRSVRVLRPIHITRAHASEAYCCQKIRILSWRHGGPNWFAYKAFTFLHNRYQLQILIFPAAVSSWHTSTSNVDGPLYSSVVTSYEHSENPIINLTPMSSH